MDSLKYHPGPPCPTLLRPTGKPPLKQPYGRFRGSQSAGRAAYDRFLPPLTPHAVRLCRNVMAPRFALFRSLWPPEEEAKEEKSGPRRRRQLRGQQLRHQLFHAVQNSFCPHIHDHFKVTFHKVHTVHTVSGAECVRNGTRLG
jgi:hypothetical protein